MLIIFSIQHRGILGRQCAEIHRPAGHHPDADVGVVPIVTGQINWANFSPLVPLAAA